MKLNMSRDEFSVVEQHIGTVAWIIVIGLLSWNVVTTNKLQIAVAELTIKLGQVDIKFIDSTSTNRLIDMRLDALERKVDKLEYAGAGLNP